MRGAQSPDDQINALRVPALDGLVVGTQKAGQPSPWIEMSSGQRPNQTAGTNNAFEDVFVSGDEGDPSHGLIHSANVCRTRRGWA